MRDQSSASPSGMHVLRRPGRASPDQEKWFGRIQSMLRVSSGIDYRHYRPAVLEKSIARRMEAHGCRSGREYLGFLQAHPEELRALEDEPLAGKPRFFREPELFETLKSEILPRLLGAREGTGPIRIWAPCCSTGQEAYSIAICLLEFLDSSGDPGIRLFATDVNERMVQIARNGCYPESIASDVGPERILRFFTQSENGYQVSKRVRDVCVFGRHDLTSDPPFAHLDMIGCHDVLSPFQPAFQTRIISMFHYALSGKGILAVGGIESLREYPHLFAAVGARSSFYQKLPTPQTVAKGSPLRLAAGQWPDPAQEEEKGWSTAELERAADRLAIARYGPPGVVIDDRMEILQTRGHTAQFLEMVPGASSLLLSRMLRPEIARETQNAVQRAIEDDAPAQERVAAVWEGRARAVSIQVLPIRGAARGRRFLVLFVDSAPEPGEAASPPIAEPVQTEDQDRSVDDLRKDLASTKLRLQSLIDERDARNQDLISANEEIRAANEELQSAVEEVETARQEVQTANRELLTINEELQHRNATLIQTTNDLNNLLNSVSIPVVMLNADLEIRRFTPAAQKLIDLRPDDIGRRLTEIRHIIGVRELTPLVREVLDDLVARERETQDRDGRWWLMRVRPYRTHENGIEGAVLILLDIDQIRRAQEELRIARDFAMGVIETVQTPLAVLDQRLNFRTANTAFRRLTGTTAEELARSSFPELEFRLWRFESLRSRLEQLGAGGFEIEMASGGPKCRVFRICARGFHPDSDERVILLTMEDVTDRKEFELTQAREKSLLKAEIQTVAQALGRTQEELRALTAGLFRSQENERRWVARELHDGVNQRLAVFDMEIQEVEGALAERSTPDRLSNLRRRVGELAEEVRRISRRLHPSILDDLGLVPALRALVEDFGGREKMLATFISHGVPETVPRETGAVLYRIAQEALHNVAKHAGQTHVKVTLEGVEDRVRLEVADLGCGFDPEGVRGGLGLISMAERARLVGAIFSIRSSLGKGATVTVEAPVAGVACEEN